MTLNSRNVAIRRGRGGYGFTVYGEAPCCIGWISRSSSCQNVGLREGDSIISVNGENVFAACHSYVVQLIGKSSDILYLELKDKSAGSMSSDEDFKTLRQSEVNEMQLHYLSKEKLCDSRRTELVLTELKDGTLFQNVLYALDASPYTTSAESHTSLRNVESKLDSGTLAQNSNAGRNILSRELNARKVLGYEGSYSSDNVFLKSVVAYLGSVGTLVDNVIEIPQFCITAIEACVTQLRQEQHIHERVLLKITQSSVRLISAAGDMIAVYNRQQIYFSTFCPSDNRFFCIATLNPKNQVQCHQFMIDAEMFEHRNHAERAKRFAIDCSTELETGHCIEFPQSSRVILNTMETLFHSQQVSPRQTQGFKVESGRGNATGYISDDVMDSKTFVHNGDHQWRTNKVKKEFVSLTLNKQNLKQHEINSGEFTDGADFSRYIDSATEFYNIMHSIPRGKHKRAGKAGTLPLKSRTSLPSEGFKLEDISTKGNKGNTSNDVSFFRFPKRSSCRQLKLNMKNMMSKSSESIQRSESAHLSGSSSIESLSSNASLPSSFYGSAVTNLENAGRIAQWAVSFDKLLQDDMGIRYFTEFLRKEFSQENILFWLDCEKLRKIPLSDSVTLKELANTIYDKYLSEQATSPVNIDSKGQRMSDEALRRPPHPEMFQQQQNQIYKLMKLDSYSRFLKSPLYYHCLHGQSEDILLPIEGNAQKESQSETSIESRHSFSLKSRRFFLRRNRKAQGSNDAIHKDSCDSESRYFDKIASTNLTDDTASMHQVSVNTSLICRLVLWDGTSTVLYAEEGKATIRDALITLCERRNIPLSAVDIYYQNEDRALALDQDVAVLAGQEVRVERRTLFRLDLMPMGRSVGVKAKPTKSIEEVLKPVVSKYGLELEALQSRINGSNELLDLSRTVNILDGLRINVSLDKKRGGDSVKKSNNREKSQLPGKSDMDDLINVMSVAQNGKMHDQRGLLSEMNLELPEFLKTSSTLSPARSLIETNENQNSNKHLEYLIPARLNEQPLDAPVTKYGKLCVNPISDKVKTRIQNQWYREMDDKYRPSTSLSTSETCRKKIPSIDFDPSNNEKCVSVTLSSIDDDPYIITKWMQSISCTPKYPYTLNLNDTLELSPGLNVASSKDAFLYVKSTQSNKQPSVSHDHRYTKRKKNTSR